MYGNFGGIGVITDERRVIDGLAGNERATLIIRDFGENVISRIVPPAEGWSNPTLCARLDLCKKFVDEHGVVSAYLGDKLIGCTEL